MEEGSGGGGVLSVLKMETYKIQQSTAHSAVLVLNVYHILVTHMYGERLSGKTRLHVEEVGKKPDHLKVVTKGMRKMSGVER